ncbi:hypothetical protein M409DRAFT_68735 [Zasmidium cellare ATCC 36951]|uniref:Mediator of RNA polymerase II transcription subunit 12 n=1 Tax=Zasmidium cellare ATCC 36951 TaxID=1080233 RepID=A0A6A6C8F1_ZASCE|nr:uncharacterized protein M409DRAFT_68735 [Zasmidium cellare ATCC 36951]KAF2163113.1 hypothetical protein M409DRAFT_68735 [Zasmidium cellare ATCC 36951]
MLLRLPALLRGTQRPPPPQRAVSGSYTLQHSLKRPQLPSRLSNLRSVSQPVNVVDLTADGAKSTDVRNSAAFLNNQGSVYTSPDVINLDDDENERPAKRVKTNGHALGKEQARDSSSEVEKDAAHQTTPGSPLPQLRKPTAAANKQNVQRTRRTVVDRTARRANGLEPPPMATRLPPPKNVADFSPWNGHHPEDIMSETVVKAGYFDKPPGPNSTECNSAKPTIWPNLSQKNNMGLQTLSYLFTSVMEKRQAMGKCTAPSTFKPPPRVTVTDTKREAWLRDLANSGVPLRKQSRTIPHGVRGKLLMEQCLSKDISMPRAVWLAKCVGANELRAFRRKGVSGAAAASGESKWVREWTVHVEQFLEGVIAMCGQTDWQSKMDYAVKLATSFYAEKLLERDHYLDWIVTSFAQAPMDRLPIWIILVQLYWRDIIGFGKRGRQLSTAILENLHRIGTGQVRTCETLRDRLKKLLVVMAVTNRGCLVLPHTWEKYKHLLAPRPLADTDAKLDTPAQNITKRNERLGGPLNKTPKNTFCALLGLYAVLDTVDFSVEVEKLTDVCLARVEDVEKLVPALLKWSASVYRQGSSRVYLSARIITELHDRGHNTDGAVMEYIKTESTQSIDINNVHRVVADLARAGCFSTGRYLKCLIGSGALTRSDSSKLLTGLLTSLPLEALPPHLANTRQTLMRRLGYTQDENTAISRLVANVDPITGMISSSTDKLFAGLETFSQSAKLEFARRISSYATSWAKEGAISLNCFCTVRDLLQRCGDLRALADVTRAAMSTEDLTLLATLGDTLNMHANTFAAIGCLHNLLEQVLQRYRMLRSTQPLDRCSVLALSSLVRRFSDRALYGRLLESDLAMCDQQNSMAVCSPASDNLVNMHASNLDSDEDIDAVFASGNTMDEQLMKRVFVRIVQRASKPGRPDTRSPSKVCRWLNQLRAVDVGGFQHLAITHVKACLKDSSPDNAYGKVISALIASGCIQFEAVTEMAKDINLPNAASVIVRLVVSENIANDNLHACEAFRYKTQQAQCRIECSGSIIPSVVGSLENPNSESDDEEFNVLALLYSMSHYQEALQVATSATHFPTYLANCARVVKRMLNLTQNKSSGPPSARDIISLADPLSVVYCAAALAFYSKVPAFIEAEGDSGIREALLEALANGCEVWPQLLGSAGQATVQSIYQWARERVISSVLASGGPPNTEDNDAAQCLDILDVAHHAAEDEDTAAVMGTVTDKLRVLENQLLALENASDNDSFKQLLSSLQILLHLAVLYSASSGPVTDSLQQSRCNLLAGLCALLVQPKLQSQRETLEYIFDVASALADKVPEAGLQMLAKANATMAKDPRLACILGHSPAPDGWLALVSHPQPQGSQQQRALMKQAGGSQQQASQGRPSVPASPLQGSNLFGKAPIGRPTGETKTVPFPLRRWEIMSDATPAVGDNDTSLSLTLFGARKV